MTDATLYNYLGVFLTAVISAAGGAAFAWAKATAQQIKEDKERDDEHDQLVDASLVVLLRQLLLDEFKRLVYQGGASHAEKLQYQQTHDTYERLCERCSAHNGVMDDYAEQVKELPTL